jgi:hypothetical protein
VQVSVSVYAIALTHLDSALALAVTVAGNVKDDTVLAASVRNAVAVAKGRLLVDMGRFSDAATAVSAVPTSYTYNVTFSQATNDNNIWGLAGQVSTRARFVVGDSFDTQGIIKNGDASTEGRLNPEMPSRGYCTCRIREEPNFNRR